MEIIFKLVNRYKNMLLSGIEITLSISLIAIVIGVVLGIVLAIMKICKVKVLNVIAGVYVEVVRGIPVMILLCISYYGASVMGIHYPRASMFGGACTSDRFIAAVIGLGLNAAAEICEVIRSGIQAVDYGQTEAALSLGLNHFASMRKIVLPQAIINILPALGNNFVSMIKTSSTVTIIGLADLMYVSNLIRGESYRPFSPFVIAGAIYFCMTYLLSRLVKVYERHINVSRVRTK